MSVFSVVFMPNDAVWLQKKIGATEAINLQKLLDCQFLEFIKTEKSARKAKVWLGNVVAFPSPSKPLEVFSETKTTVIGSNALKLKGGSASNSLAQRQTRGETETETHTEQTRKSGDDLPAENLTNNQNRVECFGSEFSTDEIGRYVDHCAANGQIVRNRAKLVTKLKQTGDADRLVRRKRENLAPMSFTNF